MRITIIEKDLLFNDVGSIDSDIEIDTSYKIVNYLFIK